MKNFSMAALFKNRTFNIIFSIIVAVICWAVIVFTVTTDSTREIVDVPVNLNSNSSVYQSLGLDIMDSTEFKVTVTVSGERKRLGALDASSINVTPIVNGVSAAGEYNLELVASKVNSMDSFTIVSVNPGTIKVRFDTAVSKKFAVTTDITGLSVADGFMIGNITSSPAEVTVTGPADEINAISRVVAKQHIGSKLDKTTTTECELVLYGESGNELSTDTVKLDVSRVDVTIPVYKRGTLRLDIEFTNVPEGFDVSNIRYVMSETEIPVAASAASIDSLTTKIIGYVDLAAFTIGESYDFDVTLPTGFVNLDNVTTVTVTFPKDDIASKRVNVNDIRIQNAPDNYDITVVTARINDVTVIGPRADVEALLPSSVIAVVDISGITLESGVYNVPVSFTVTANNTTWAIGSYTVTIEAYPN